MGVGTGGSYPLLILKILAKQFVFLVSREKNMFH